MNVAVPNVCLFAKDVFGMKDQQICNLMIFSLIFSALAAFGAGHVSDRLGPKERSSQHSCCGSWRSWPLR